MVSCFQEKLGYTSSEIKRGGVWSSSTIKVGNEFAVIFGEKVGDKLWEVLREIYREEIKQRYLVYIREIVQ